MSTGEGRKLTLEDIDKVKNLIEKCILNYKTEKETVNVLHQEHNIEPCFTKIVWKNLVEQNQHFFSNYCLRLVLIDQIKRFNDLLEKQAALMNQLNPNEAAAATGFPPGNLAEQPVPLDLPPHGLDNGGSLGLQHSFDYQFNTMLAQNQNVGMIEHSPINNESSDLGNSAASSSNVDSNSHQLQRTFSDDLSMYLSPHPDNALFDSNGIVVQNKGVPNMSSNLNFQNSGFAEMSQRSNFFS